jgi:hypothetical protein
MCSLKPPRHISTPPDSEVAMNSQRVCSTPHNGLTHIKCRFMLCILYVRNGMPI